MGLHRIKKGLDLPIAGEPEQTIEVARQPSKVALIADDYVGMRPTMAVQVGDQVKRGQLLFEDKKTPGVRYTAPAAGRVVALNRGARRVFQSLVIEMTGGERDGRPDASEMVKFDSYAGKAPAQMSREEIKALLVESGLWTALRGRPFGRVPDPQTTPRSIFVTAMDTNPLAGSVDVILEGKEKDFETGLAAVAKLTDGPTFLCKGPNSKVAAMPGGNVRTEVFEGPHPSGTVGVHIHTLDPVCRAKVVWYVNYQDVVRIGRLMTTGVLDVEQTVALAGPAAKRPRLLQTRIGASVDELVGGELDADAVRVISGSVLSGRTAMGDVLGYLGRYHLQVSALAEGHDRQFMAWLRLGPNKFSVIPTFIGRLLKGRKFNFTTTTNGSDRAIVPIGMYEQVMPMDIQPTYLLRSLVSGDLDQAEKLGALELEEEDLALCTFVCPGKTEYGPILRDILTTIEKEG